MAAEQNIPKLQLPDKLGETLDWPRWTQKKWTQQFPFLFFYCNLDVVTGNVHVLLRVSVAKQPCQILSIFSTAGGNADALCCLSLTSLSQKYNFLSIL